MLNATFQKKKKDSELELGQTISFTINLKCHTLDKNWEWFTQKGI